jgi:hypothetical protein
MVSLEQRLNDDISHTHQEDQHIAKAKEIVPVDVFSVAIIEIKVDPTVVVTMSVYEKMIAANVAVLLPLFMQESDGFDGLDESLKD